MKGRVRGVGVWTAAFVASLLLWLVLTSTVAWNEVLTGVVAAALAATAAWLAARRRAPRPQDRWPDALRLAGGWRVLAVLPWRVAADTVRAVRALALTLRGEDVGELRALGASYGGARYQTVATLLVSMSANEVVAGFDDEGQAWVHSLVPRGRASIDEVLRKP